MTPKSFALICLILLLCALASAQDYAVRVTYATNVRASYSLQSPVVDTAPAGTTLQVLDSHNRWLRVSRSGNSGWLADWVPMTRIAGAQTPTNIDNCCFLNWQCGSEAEWARGYAAYQSDSCDGGATDLGGLRVDGRAGFKALVGRALNLLSTRAPQWYHYAITGLNVVVEVNPPHGSSGVYLQTGVARFNLASPYIPIPEDDMTMAEFLVHEACHVHRYRAGLEPGGYPGEKACVEAEAALWQEAAPNSAHHNRKRRYLANIHRRECQHWLPPAPGGCPYW